MDRDVGLFVQFLILMIGMVWGFTTLHHNIDNHNAKQDRYYEKFVELLQKRNK